jgi:23S rRNA (adenine2503-C2)-methyltransferase
MKLSPDNVSGLQAFLEQPEGVLLDWLAERGEPKYRLGQIQGWIWQRRADSFEAMSDLPKRLRDALAAQFTLFTTRIARRHVASDGTEKLLVELPDRNQVECVLLKAHERRTVCLSTQVGCAMGCVFCASGLDGVIRNLTASEIAQQLLWTARQLPPEERISHLVVMGMGEPLANLDNLLSALAWATSPRGMGISPRRITISTVGLPAALRRLAELNAPYQLAVSLHASNDALRNQLVPVNRQIGVAAILEAADAYFAATRRRVTFEYVLLGGLNDGPEHARELGMLLKDRTAVVNVIPYNPVEGLGYRAPTDAGLFGVETPVRRRRGDQINAACGQLRRAAAGAAVVPVGTESGLAAMQPE